MKTYDKKTYDSKFLADGPIRIHPHTYYQGHGVDIVNQLNRLFMSIGKMETSTTFDGTALTPAQLASMVGSLTDGMKFKVVADGNTYYGTGSKGSEYYNIDCGDDGHVGVFYDGSGTLVEGLFSDVSAVTVGKQERVFKWNISGTGGESTGYSFEDSSDTTNYPEFTL